MSARRSAANAAASVPVAASGESSQTRADGVRSALSDWQDDGGQNLAVPVPSQGEPNRWQPSARLCVTSYRRWRVGGGTLLSGSLL